MPIQIARLSTYTQAEIFEKIVLPLVETFEELCWFADEKVFKTNEKPGAFVADLGWTGLLASKFNSDGIPLIKKSTGKYVELERTLSSMVFFHLFYDGSREAYNKFISVQKESILSFESFSSVHALARKVAHDESSYHKMMTLLCYSDLGKTPKARENADVIARKLMAEKISSTSSIVKLLSDKCPEKAFEKIPEKFSEKGPEICPETLSEIPKDHDLFSEWVMSLDVKSIAEIIPSFAKQGINALSIRQVFRTMKIHMGHLYHLEGGEAMFDNFVAAVKSCEVTEEAFDSAFLVQLCDVAASQAHGNCQGSLAYDETTHQGYELAKTTLKSIQNGTTAKLALQQHLKARGEFLGIPTMDPETRLTIRIGCFLRLFSKEDGVLLLRAMKTLLPDKLPELIAQFDIAGKEEIGINAWKRNPTYLPAVLLNLANFTVKSEHDKGETESRFIKIVRALEGAVCIAALLKKYASVPLHKESLSPLSLNALAEIAVKQPELLSLKHFKPETFDFDPIKGVILAAVPITPLYASSSQSSLAASSAHKDLSLRIAL